MKTIYLRTNTVNGKQYIGQTVDWKQRERDWRCLKKFKYANKLLSIDRASYNLDDWENKILKVCEDSEGDYWEKYYIKEYNTKYPNGYNMSDGGKGPTNYIHTEEQNKLQSERMKNMPDYVRKKISESIKGENHPNWGKHLSEEIKNKISESNKGRITPSTCKKVYQYTLDGELVGVYPSTSEAERQTGFYHQGIAACCRGVIKQSKGYKWSYEPL